MTSHYSIDCPIGIKYTKLKPGAKEPTQMTVGSSGFDLFALHDRVIYSGMCELVPTGIAVEIPKLYEGQIRPRSSMSRRLLFTHFGTIDSDYRGELQVLIANGGPQTYQVLKGERIAQLVITPVIPAKFFNTAELDDTERGDGGFGSTGK